MLQLAHKLYLLLLLAVPLLAWWQWRTLKRGQRHISFSARALVPAGVSPRKGWLFLHLFHFKLAVLTLLILTLARPQWLNSYQEAENKGIDILLVLDISGSMASIDFKPKNRIEVAKDVIAGFVEKRQSDRIGLVIFSATSYTKCPLTVDYDMLKYQLSETNIGELEDGTALGMALATAVNRISHSTVKSKIIILLTDGVNNRGEIDPRDAAKMARDFHIKVYTIGVGTRGSAPYPVKDTFGRLQYVMVNVEIDETLLQEIASTTGGLYFRATDSASLNAIFTDIDRWEKTKIVVKTYTDTRELYLYLLAIALLLLALIEIARRSFLRVLP
jgi:Ca-activated chloride channel homolog